MDKAAIAVGQTKKWITETVIACNFCPFASREMKLGTVHFRVTNTIDPIESLDIFLDQCKMLDNDNKIETSFLIFPDGFGDFNDYLSLVEMAEKSLKKNKYEGIYQVASFHPLYRFEGTLENDAANYTNRSPYPMLHLLREESIEKVLEKYPDPEIIPQRNIKFTREKGEAYMKMLLEASFRF